MYLNLVQLAESFGVSESTVHNWIKVEGLPAIAERDRLLFDRAQVAQWAAARGLGAQAGFLTAAAPAFATGWRLESLLRQGGIWRDVAPAEFGATLGRVVTALPGVAPAVRTLLVQRLQAHGGVTLAPVGGGFAMPHPAARIALGRDAGTLALILLREPLAEPGPDGLPINRLFFFLAPSPRAHLDLLGRLSRALSRTVLRELVTRAAPDDEIYAALAKADAGATPPPEAGA